MGEDEQPPPLPDDAPPPDAPLPDANPPLPVEPVPSTVQQETQATSSIPHVEKQQQQQAGDQAGTSSKADSESGPTGGASSKGPPEAPEAITAKASAEEAALLKASMLTAAGNRVVQQLGDASGVPCSMCAVPFTAVACAFGVIQIPACSPSVQVLCIQSQCPGSLHAIPVSSYLPNVQSSNTVL